MQKFESFDSPLGEIFMSADSRGLTGLWFKEQRTSEFIRPEEFIQTGCAVFDLTKKWLDVYFSGRNPGFEVPLNLFGTEFQLLVWHEISLVPFGCTRSYGDIARSIASKRGIERMSARAVGRAVGLNPVSIIIPCHRIIGSSGSLTGYAGGLDKKIALLACEGLNTDGRKIIR